MPEIIVNKQLSGKIAFVSGSSSGLGLEIAKALHDQGAFVILNGRKISKLKKISKQLENTDYFCGDVSDAKIAEACKVFILNKFRKLDILVCNVGFSSLPKTGSQTKKDWEKSFRYNLFSTTNLVETFDEAISNRRGTILCISSICGIEHIPGAPVSYSAAKSALNSFVNSSSRYFGSKGVNINALAPGNIFFHGSVWDKKMKSNERETKRFLKREVPLGNLLDASEVAKVAVFLCSQDSKIITGSIITADAGQTRS